MTTTEIEPTVETEEAPALHEMQPVSGDDMALEQVGEALMAVPVALLCAANSLTIIGATAWQAAGATGLAGTGAAMGGTAGAAWMVRRAHRAEARRLEEAKSPPKAGQKPAATTPPPGRRAIAPSATGARAAADALGLRNRAARAARKGGTSTGRTSGKAPGMPSFAMPGARSGAAGSARKATGGSRRTPSGKTAGASRLSKLATMGRSNGGRTAGATGASRMPGLATPGSTSRGATSGRRTAGSRAGKAIGGGLGAMRRTAGTGSSSAGRSAQGAASSARRAASGAAQEIGRAGSTGTAKLGRRTHALAGSGPGRRAAASGRRIAGTAKSAGAAVRRAHSSGRAAIAGAAQAKGQGVRAAARAAKAAVTAEHTRQDRATGKAASRVARVRRIFTRNAAAAAAGGGVLSARAARGAGRWGRWGWRAVRARITGDSLPLTPRRAAEAQRAAEADTSRHGHPAVGDAVTQPPATAGQIQPTQGAHQMSTLGLLLHDLSGQMAAAATGYEPDGMLQWGADMQALEGVLDNVAGVLRALEKGADDLPIEPAVKHTLASVGALQSSCSSAAAEIHHTFRAVHEAELDRLENPRPGERKWDAAANQ